MGYRLPPSLFTNARSPERFKCIIYWVSWLGAEVRQSGVSIPQLHFVALLYGSLIACNRSTHLNTYLWKKVYHATRLQTLHCIKSFLSFQSFYYTDFWGGGGHLISVADRQPHFHGQTRARFLGNWNHVVDGDPSEAICVYFKCLDTYYLVNYWGKSLERIW